MYALFEDGGKFLAGRVMSETDSSLQIELASGKRAKVKAANVLLRFASPEPDALLAAAGASAAEIDLDLAWEFAPEGEFGFGQLARDYFGASTGTVQQAAALLGLFGAPHYFRRLGKGNFRKAPEETVKAALLGIERKKQVAAQIGAWASELAAGACPPAVREQIYKILFRPDKNAPEYKAVVDAARRTGRAPLDLLKAAGANVVPLGKCSNRNRRQWNWYGESIAPAAFSRSSGARPVRLAASTTALYSGAFLSGRNRIL